jgi:hypothetical protein
VIYVNEDRRKWEACVQGWTQGTSPPGGQAFFGRLAHEIHHYLQFFACGHYTALCAEQFDAVRRAVPFPLDQARLDAFLGTPQPVPAPFAEIDAHLRRPGAGDLTVEQILEGCARLFQARRERPGLLHGAWLLELTHAPEPELYGRFYRQVSAQLGARALQETLFLGSTALEYADPVPAALLLLALRTEGKGACGAADLHVAHAALTRELLGHGFGRLGSARDLADAGRTRHPLLEERWIFHAAPDWQRAVRDAVWDNRPGIVEEVLLHAEFLLNDVMWLAPGRDAEQRAASEVRYIIARLSRHLGKGKETRHVQPAEPRP